MTCVQGIVLTLLFIPRPHRVQVDPEQGLMALQQAVALREVSVSVGLDGWAAGCCSAEGGVGECGP